MHAAPVHRGGAPLPRYTWRAMATSKKNAKVLHFAPPVHGDTLAALSPAAGNPRCGCAVSHLCSVKAAFVLGLSHHIPALPAFKRENIYARRIFGFSAFILGLPRLAQQPYGPGIGMPIGCCGRMRVHALRRVAARALCRGCHHNTCEIPRGSGHARRAIGNAPPIIGGMPPTMPGGGMMESGIMGLATNASCTPTLHRPRPLVAGR